MARRDRRRGGAHSAPRKGKRKSKDKDKGKDKDKDKSRSYPVSPPDRTGAGHVGDTPVTPDPPAVVEPPPPSPQTPFSLPDSPPPLLPPDSPVPLSLTHSPGPVSGAFSLPDSPPPLLPPDSPVPLSLTHSPGPVSGQTPPWSAANGEGDAEGEEAEGKEAEGSEADGDEAEDLGAASPPPAPDADPPPAAARIAGVLSASDILAVDFPNADFEPAPSRKSRRSSERSASRRKSKAKRGTEGKDPPTGSTEGQGSAEPTGSTGDSRGGGVEGTGNRKRRGRRKRSWLDRILLAGVVVVAMALLAVGSSYAYIQYRFDQVTKVSVKHLTRAPVGQPFNVLLIGSDSRAGLSAADQVHFGNQSAAGGQRSDVVKVVHVIPATGQVSVLSIPRDTVVSVAGNSSEIGKYNRINATYNTGPDQLVQTIEANFGIPIEHVVQINFDGFRGAVDAIGGINLNFPYPAMDSYTGLNIQQTGCQHVNGESSLAVARSRHYEYKKNGYWQYDGTSDFGRIQRQNAFLKALINQAETKYNPLTLNAFIGSVVQGVTIDSTFSASDLISLARQFHTFASQSLATATLPTYSADSSEFGYLGSVLYVQQPQASQVISQFLGQAPEPAPTPAPGPYGVVSTTTTTSTAPTTTTTSTHGSTPGTSASTSTTTTIETDFDPTPC
jgi:LCP family protein required for cell wall assembly